MQRHMLGPFEMGRRDCVLSALRVSDDLTGCRNADKLAAIYSDDASANRALADRGGLTSAVLALYTNMGFSAHTDTLYKDGDVAVIRGVTLGVWIGDGWACKTPGGVAVKGDAVEIHYRPIR